MFSRVTKVQLKEISDERGSLVAIENGRGIPFDPKRVYYIFNTKENKVRGFHAHKKLSQLLIVTSGSVSVKCEYRNRSEIYVLNAPNEGLLIEGLVWREMFDFSKGAVLIVIASDCYDESDYVRDYNEFKYLEME